ncbi:helix-turn-helix transcriptional regulator [Inediibacterium massiliense]|uniref:helix-turn-helix transcriptional regulator n=1 Tax=Inediibacterium massiliense TaxID=1658111 RepID=UPI0006B5E2A8|nr:helix-turn-helix transcriptional regulator [Inediibacterium massiliense]
MPFKKINAQEIVKDKIEKDQEFKAAYEEISEEYKLIREVVKARKEMGLTQQNLADKIGVKQQVISRFENERHIPTLDNFLKILHGLDLEISICKKKDCISI